MVAIKPKRIQRKRAKGWRTPDGAIYVGRPTRYGNPFKIGTHTSWVGTLETQAQLVQAYRDWFIWTT